MFNNIDTIVVENIRDSHKFLPYWLSNGKIYRSKLLALIDATKNKNQISFHFNDEVLGNIDWTREPLYNIEHYYKIRAESLRDKYDYIVVMLSGGADSTTIVKTFVNNNIKIDEIATYGVWNKNIDKWYELDNLEIKFAASDILKKCATKGIKISHLNILDGIENLKTEDWIYSSDPLFNASQSCRYPVVYDRADLKKMISQGKKVAVILGHDKPRVICDGGSLYTSFCDMGGIGTGLFPQFFDKDYDGPTVELFYTNVVVPEIMIKQSHMIAHWYLNTFGKDVKNLLNIHTFDPKFLSRTNSIIYPSTWLETKTYTLGKGLWSSGIGIRETPFHKKLKAPEWRSEWMYINLSDTVYNRNWQNGIKKAFGMLDDCFVDREKIKLHGHWTRYYKLMDLNF